MIQTLSFSIFFFLLPLWVIVFVIYGRHKITSMTGMMASMTVGMSVGLGLGTWAAVVFPISLFYSSLLGMFLGGMAGTLTGLPVSLMAVLDGLLSGVMAGLMGAMLGEMISADYRFLLLQILGIFTGGVLFLMFLVLQREVGTEHFPSYLRKPAWMFVLIVLGGIGMQPISSFSPPTMHDSNMNMHSHQQSPVHITINASEFSFKPAVIRIPTHETVELILRNNGKSEHVLEIPGLKFKLEARPGMQAAGSVRIMTSGVYQAVCTVPGHKEAGMTLQIQAS